MPTLNRILQEQRRQRVPSPAEIEQRLRALAEAIVCGDFDKIAEFQQMKEKASPEIQELLAKAIVVKPFTSRTRKR